MTELIADRVLRSKDQLELAIVERVGWYNHTRLGGRGRRLRFDRVFSVIAGPAAGDTAEG